MSVAMDEGGDLRALIGYNIIEVYNKILSVVRTCRTILSLSLSLVELLHKYYVFTWVFNIT